MSRIGLPSGLVTTFPGVVISSNITGPAPSSQFHYTVFANIPGRPQEITKVVPVMERWDDSVKCKPIKPGTVVTIGSVSGQLQLMARELPHFESCPGGDSLLSNPGDLLRTVQAMTREQRRLLRSLLEL